MTDTPRNGNGNRFSISSLSEKSWFSWTMLTSAILVTLWISAIYWGMRGNTKDNEELRDLVAAQSVRLDSTRAQIESVRVEMRGSLDRLATKDDTKLFIQNAVNEAMLGVYRELGEIKGRLKSLEDRMPPRGG